MGAKTPRSVKAEMQLRQKRAQALQLRAEGRSFNQIAAQLGYANASGAYKAVRTGLAEVDQEPAKELLRLQLARLDDLLAEVWPKAVDGGDVAHLRSVSAALAVMRRMDILVGLDSCRGNNERWARKSRPTNRADGRVRRTAHGTGRWHE